VRRERESVGVVLPAGLPFVVDVEEVLVSRAIGLDVHRDFCEVAIRERGQTRSVGKVATAPERLELFAASLVPSDRVVLEATGNAWAIAQVLLPHVADVVLAHPKKLRAIAESKVKTDKIDARVLAELLAAEIVPRVWIGDEQTRMLRRLVSRRRGLVKRRTPDQERDPGGAASQSQGAPAGVRTCSATAGGCGWPSSSCRSMSG
jgi:transposase